MLKSFLYSLILFLILDGIWLGFIMKDFNLKQLSLIARITDGKFDLLYVPAILTYLLMAASVVLFSLPRAQAAGSGIEAFLWGAGLGLCIYGVYDMTNLAVLKDYPLAFAAADMSWGFVQYGIVTWIVGWQLKA